MWKKDLPQATQNLRSMWISQKQNKKMYDYLITLDDGWGGKVRSRKGEGTGQMRHLKDVPRRFRNKFRTENTFKKALGEKPAVNKGRSVMPRRRLK